MMLSTDHVPQAASAKYGPLQGIVNVEPASPAATGGVLQL